MANGSWMTRRGWPAATAGRRRSSANLTEPAQVEEAVRELADRVLADVAAEGRPVVGLTLKVRYAPFVTKILTKRVAETFDRETVLAEILGLVGRIEPNRPIRLLGLRAEMPMPEDAREGHTPTRSGWCMGAGTAPISPRPYFGWHDHHQSSRAMDHRCIRGHRLPSSCGA